MAKTAKKKAPAKKVAVKKATPAKKGKTLEKVDPVKTIDSLKEQTSIVEKEFSLFMGGNKTAGRRVRKALQEIRKLAGNGRKEVMELIKANKAS